MTSFHLPHLPGSLAALFYSAGYLAGGAAFFWMARRRGIATGGMMAVMAAGLLGGLVAANLIQLATGSPGKTVLGALAGGYVAVWLYKRRLGITRPTGDLFAVALCVGEAIGRWGCYFGGCCYGKATAVSWAVWQHGAWRHPAQIYLSVSCTLILFALLAFSTRRPPENGLFFLQGMLYCIVRFAIEFFRENSVVSGGLSLAQLACLGGVVFFGFMLFRLLHGSANAHTGLTMETAVSD